MFLRNRMHVRPASLVFEMRGSRYYESNIFSGGYLFSELIAKWSYSSHSWPDETSQSYDWDRMERR
jgi:hypothetical protein